MSHQRQAVVGGASVLPGAFSLSVMGSGYAHSGSLWEGEWEEVIRTQVHQGVDLGALLALPRGKTGTLMLPENAKANLRFRMRCPPPPFPSFCSAISPVTQLSTSVVETEDGGGRRPSAPPASPHFRKMSHPARPPSSEASRVAGHYILDTQIQVPNSSLHKKLP